MRKLKSDFVYITTKMNYTATFEKTYKEMTSVDFNNMKKNLMNTSPTLEKAMLEEPDSIDWMKVSRNFILPAEVLRQHIQRLDRPLIGKIQNIPEDILLTRLGDFDWNDAQEYQVLPLRVIQNNYEIFDSAKALRSVKYPQETINYLAERDANLIDIIFQYQTVDTSFIEKYINSHNSNIVGTYQQLSSDLIEKYIDLFNLNTLVLSQKFSEEFIEKHISAMQLSDIAKYQNLSYDFCKRHNIRDSQIIMYQTPDLDFVTRLTSESSLIILFNRITSPIIHGLNPLVNAPFESHILGLYQKDTISQKRLDDAFIISHIDSLDMIYTLLYNTNLSVNSIRTITPLVNGICKCLIYIRQDNLPVDWRKNTTMLQFWNDQTSLGIVQKMQPQQLDMFAKVFTSYIEKSVRWSIFLQKNQVPEWFIGQFKNHIDWQYVIRYQQMSMDFIQQYLIHIDVNSLVQYVQLSPEFIINNRDILVWDLICTKQIITPEIIRQCREYVDITALKQNKITPNIPELLEIYETP